VSGEQAAGVVAPTAVPWPPYRSGHEHIADLLARHDWLLKREIARGQARKPADILGFAAITEQEVQRLLTVRDPESFPELDEIESALRDIERSIAARLAQSAAAGVRLPLVELAARLGLSAAEIDILFACLAVELDRRYERIYGFLHDDMSRRQPSPGLVLSLYAESTLEQLDARALLGPLASLRYYRLIEVLEEGAANPWASRPMRIDERIVAFLLGDNTVDSRLARHLVRADVAPESLRAGATGLALVEELVKQLMHWTKGASPRGKPFVYVQGPRAAGADTVIRLAAAKLGMPLLTCDAEALVEAGAQLEQSLFLLFRESLLTGAAIFLRDADRLFEPTAGSTHHRTLLRLLTEMGTSLFVSAERPWSWALPAAPVLLRVADLRAPGVLEQFEAWQTLSRGRLPAAELYRLVSLHPLPISAIDPAWRMAEDLAAGAGVFDLPRIEDLRQACRVHGGVPGNTLARRIEPKHTWEDLVLPARQLEQLHAVCNEARQGSVVFGEWGFERKLSLGKGLNVLFTGPPGTGKTMAAEVVAADLGVHLLKIDLSRIVSKYIGETEKNLRELFDQATSANAILFFDEADALLGKRSEVKDAHDRYANTETAYLLQKMEEYTGISILSTNLRQNMDEAFTRRMRFIVDFPLPEDEDRLRIWQAVWPRELPLAPDVDLPGLARQFRLTGGSIRNIALSAAFLAAEQNQPVSMRHLMRATRRELHKMGRLVSDETRRA
jgi:winged helix domain-containing protein/ATPase family protein associated with various cellular activities (AAA)